MTAEEAYRTAALLYNEAVRQHAETCKWSGRSLYTAVTVDTEHYHRRVLGVAAFLLRDKPKETRL